MGIRLAIGIMMICSTAQGVTPKAAGYPAPSHPLMSGLYGSVAVQNAVSQSQDTLDGIDINSPNYRYPGKAMVLSLAVPGAGQLYVGQPKRTVLFIGMEILSIWAWNNYAQQGKDATKDFEAYADEYWSFWRWLNTYQDYRTDPWGTEPGQIYVGPGTDKLGHPLEFYIDIDGDGNLEIYNTKDHSSVLEPYLSTDPVIRDTIVFIARNHEYYENIGKYNQFFSGWEEATAGAEIEQRKSGPHALNDYRSKYLDMRGEANRLKNVASYAISALMFNHVISAVDAIFATSRWNREHARRISGRLWFNPSVSHGVGGVQISLAW